MRTDLYLLTDNRKDTVEPYLSRTEAESVLAARRAEYRAERAEEDVMARCEWSEYIECSLWIDVLRAELVLTSAPYRYDWGATYPLGAEDATPYLAREKAGSGYRVVAVVGGLAEGQIGRYLSGGYGARMIEP